MDAFFTMAHLTGNSPVFRRILSLFILIFNVNQELAQSADKSFAGRFRRKKLRPLRFRLRRKLRSAAFRPPLPTANTSLVCGGDPQAVGCRGKALARAPQDAKYPQNVLKTFPDVPQARRRFMQA